MGGWGHIRGWMGSHSWVDGVTSMGGWGHIRGWMGSHPWVDGVSPIQSCLGLLE